MNTNFLQSSAYEIPVWQMSVGEVKALIETNRQQADRIADLEKQLAFMEGEYPEPTIVEKMKEFAKQSEPVAWMLTLPDGTHDWILDGHNCEGYIPLYTTPHHASDVKQTKPEGYGKAVPLSDEEIAIMSDQILCYQIYDAKNSGVYEFARAIEAKVRGEK